MEKRGLGRGLSALISEALPTESDSMVRLVPIGQIAANPYQPRAFFDPEKMEELTASVREHGILQPILLRQVGHERYQIIAGERRFRAAQQAGLPEAPALIKEVSGQAQLEVAIVENVQREDIGALEAARAYRRLMDEFGMTQAAIGQRVGKSRVAITNTIGLLQLPEAVLAALERGDITEGHARALKVAEHDNLILKAFQEVVKHRLTVRDTEQLARNLKNAPASALAGDAREETPRERRSERSERNLPTDPHEAAVIEQLQEALGTKVTLRRLSGETGRLEIEFYSQEELEGLVEMLMERSRR